MGQPDLEKILQEAPPVKSEQIYRGGRASKVLIGSLFLLLVLGVIFLWLSGQSEPAYPSNASTLVPALPVAKRPTESVLALDATLVGKSEESGTTLATRFETLAASARAGSSDAALELHALLYDCIRAGELLRRADKLVRSSPPEEDPRAPAPRELQAAEELVLDADVLAESCKGLSEDQLASARSWLEMAARTGDPKAIIAFATLGDPGLYTSDPPLSYAEELLSFKQTIGSMLLSSARGCDGNAVLMVRSAYSEGTFLPRDPSRALAYFYIGNILSGSPQAPPVQRMEAFFQEGLSAEQIDASRSWAHSFVAQYCR